MNLWNRWLSLVSDLRPACTRRATFLWMACALAGFCVRPEFLGVTSIVRALGLTPACYPRLLALFHSSALRLGALTAAWCRAAASSGASQVQLNGRWLLVADGHKVRKSGRHMPGTKRLHQTPSDAKPAFTFGHSLQVIAGLFHSNLSSVAVPLAGRIHEGLRDGCRDARTQLDRLLELLLSLPLSAPILLLADAYYCKGGFLRTLLSNGHHLITRCKTNVVAHRPLGPRTQAPRRGRPRLYGAKVKLRSLFRNIHKWDSIPCPYESGSDTPLYVRAVDLVWRKAGRLVRFVLVVHPGRGRFILLSSDLTLSAAQIVQAYSLRMKIELTFKQAVHSLGAFFYHFWTLAFPRRRNPKGDVLLDQLPPESVRAVGRKFDAYNRFIQLALIAQGLLQLLAAMLPVDVDRHFGSWLRTRRPGRALSEAIVSSALRNTLGEFLRVSRKAGIFAKFLTDRLDLTRTEGLRLAS